MPLKPIKIKQRIFADGITADKAVVVAKRAQKRWPEMEPLILKYPESACRYAIFVIKERWPEAEPVILQNNTFANLYAFHVVKGRWPELEQKYSNHPNSADHKEYLKGLQRLLKFRLHNLKKEKRRLELNL